MRKPLLFAPAERRRADNKEELIRPSSGEEPPHRSTSVTIGLPSHEATFIEERKRNES